MLPNPFADQETYSIIKDILIPLFSALLSFIAILVAIKALRDNTKIARANFEFQITLSDRDTWRHIASNKLDRIKDPLADSTQISEEERINTNFIILNVKAIFEAMELGIINSSIRKNLLMKDVGEFFSLPIPNKVWEMVKPYHTHTFQEYMDKSILLVTRQSNTNSRKKSRFDKLVSNLSKPKPQSLFRMKRK